MRIYFRKYLQRWAKARENSKILDGSKEVNYKHFIKKIAQMEELLANFSSHQVVIQSNNSVDWIVLYFVAKMLERNVFVVPPEKSENDLDEILSKIGNLIYFSENLNLTMSGTSQLSDFSSNIKAFRKDGKSCIEFKNADVLFTSGTSGKSKAVAISPECATFTAKNLVSILRMNSSQTELLAMPFSHSFGLARLRAAIIAGTSIDVHNGLKNFPRILVEILNRKIQGIGLVPSALEILKEFAKSRSNELGYALDYMEIGSSSISLETRRWLKEFFPKTKIWHHFGMTEASRSFFIERGAKDSLEEGFYIGDAAPGVSWKIRRKTSKNKGELWIAGKNLATSYLFDSSLTKERFRNGGFYTGDSVILTNGKIKLVGRLDSKINVGGLKVDCQQMETNLMDIDGIEDVLCFAALDRIYGQRPAVLLKIIPSVSRELIINKIINSEPLNSPKRILRNNIRFTDSIPKTSNGKKLRDSLRLSKLMGDLDA